MSKEQRRNEEPFMPAFRQKPPARPVDEGEKKNPAVCMPVQQG